MINDIVNTIKWTFITQIHKNLRFLLKMIYVGLMIPIQVHTKQIDNVWNTEANGEKIV